MSKPIHIPFDDFRLTKPHNTHFIENKIMECIDYSYDFQNISIQILERRCKNTKKVSYEMYLLRDTIPFTVRLIHFTFEDSYYTHFDCINSTGRFFIRQYDKDWKSEKEMLMEVDFWRPDKKRFYSDFHKKYIEIKKSHLD